MESACAKPTAARYVSCIKLCGYPILAPFMDASKRAEMRQLRERAITAERWLQQKRDRGKRVADRTDPALSEGNQSLVQGNTASAENSRSLAKPLSPTTSRSSSLFQEYVNSVFVPSQACQSLCSLDDMAACLENTIENQLSFDANVIPQPTPELKNYDAVSNSDGRRFDRTARDSARESSAISLESLATLRDEGSDAGVGVWVDLATGSERSSAALKDGDVGIEVLFSRVHDDGLNATGSLNTTGSTDLNAYMDLTASSVGSPPSDALRAQDIVLTPFHSALSVALSRHSVTEPESNTKTQCNTTESWSKMTESQHSTTDPEHNRTDETNVQYSNTIDGGFPSSYVQFPCLPSDVPSTSRSSPHARLKSPDACLESPDICLESPDICLKSPDIRLKPLDINLKSSDVCLKSPDIFLTPGPSVVCSDAPQTTVFFTSALSSDLQHQKTFNVEKVCEKRPNLAEQSHGQVIGERKHFAWKLPSEEGTSSFGFTSPTRRVDDAESRQLVDALDLPSVPPLVRQNSYTLLAGPSPLIVAHMRQSVGPRSPPARCGSAARKGWDLASAKQMWSSADTIHRLFAVPRPPDRRRNASLPASALPSPVKKPHFSPSLEHLPARGRARQPTPKAVPTPAKQATHSAKKQAAAHTPTKQSTRRSLFVADIPSASGSARRASLGGSVQRARHHAADCPRKATGVQADSSHSLKKATGSLNIAADLEGQSRESQSRRSESRDTQSADTQSTDTQSRDSNSWDSQSRDSQSRASQSAQNADCRQGDPLQSEGWRNEKRPVETCYESEVRHMIGTERDRLQGELDRQMALLMARQLADQERMRREFRLQEEKLIEDLRRRLSASTGVAAVASSSLDDVIPLGDSSVRPASSVAPRSADEDAESYGGCESRDGSRSRRGVPTSDSQSLECSKQAIVLAQDRSGVVVMTSQRTVGVDLTRESCQHIDSSVDLISQRNQSNILTRESYQHVDSSVDLTTQFNQQRNIPTKESCQHVNSSVDLTSLHNQRNISVDLIRESHQHIDSNLDMTSQRNQRNVGNNRHAVHESQKENVGGSVKSDSLKPQARPGETFRPLDQNNLLLLDYQPPDQNNRLQLDYQPPDQNNRLQSDYQPPDHNNRLLSDYLPPDHNNRLLTDYLPPDHNNRLPSDYLPPDQNNRLLSDYLPPDHNNRLLSDLPPDHNNRLQSDNQPSDQNNRSLSDCRPPPPSLDGIVSRRSSSAATWGDRLTTNSRAGTQGHRYACSPEEKAAASRIVAAARGYLVRRLMRTNHVRDIVRTIKDVMLAAMELHQDDLLRVEDVELSRRLIHQLNASWISFSDVFFSMSTSERMALIAADRSRAVARLDSNRAVRRVSSATQRSLKRKLDSHGGSQRSSISPMSRSLPSTRPCSSVQHSSASSARHSPASSALLPSRKPWR